MNYTTKSSVPFFINGCLSPCGFVSKFASFGKREGVRMHIFSSNGYHIAVGHRGVTISADISFFYFSQNFLNKAEWEEKCMEGMFSNFVVEHPPLLNLGPASCSCMASTGGLPLKQKDLFGVTFIILHIL